MPQSNNMTKTVDLTTKKINVVMQNGSYRVAALAAILKQEIVNNIKIEMRTTYERRQHQA